MCLIKHISKKGNKKIHEKNYNEPYLFLLDRYSKLVNSGSLAGNIYIYIYKDLFLHILIISDIVLVMVYIIRSFAGRKSCVMSRCLLLQ